MDLKQRIELFERIDKAGNKLKIIRDIRASTRTFNDTDALKILNKQLSEETNKLKKEILNKKIYVLEELRKPVKQTLKLLDDLRDEFRNISSNHDHHWRDICICHLFPPGLVPNVYADEFNNPKQSIATLAISTLFSGHFYSGVNLDSRLFSFMRITYHLGHDTFNIFEGGMRRILEYTDKNTIKDTFDIFTDEIEKWIEIRYEYSGNDRVSNFREELRIRVEKLGGTEWSEFLFDKDATAKST